MKLDLKIEETPIMVNDEGMQFMIVFSTKISKKQYIEILETLKPSLPGIIQVELDVSK